MSKKLPAGLHAKAGGFFVAVVHAFHELSRPLYLIRPGATGQRPRQMQAAHILRAVEIGERAREAQDAAIAPRGKPHDVSRVAQCQRSASPVTSVL
jgi:hypothetical protein